MCSLHFGCHPYQCSKFLSLTSGNLFKLTPETFEYDPPNLNNPPAFWYVKMFQVHLEIFCPRPEISHFLEESQFLLLGMEFRDYNVVNQGYLMLLCHSLFLGLFSRFYMLAYYLPSLHIRNLICLFYLLKQFRMQIISSVTL